MASFDIKSELNIHELTNAVDQANRVLKSRFDFKGTGAEFTLTDKLINLSIFNKSSKLSKIKNMIFLFNLIILETKNGFKPSHCSIPFNNFRNDSFYFFY